MREGKKLVCDKCGEEIRTDDYYHKVTVKNINQYEEEYPSKELYDLCYDCEPKVFKNMKSGTRVLL